MPFSSNGYERYKFFNNKVYFVSCGNNCDEFYEV